MLCPNSRWFFPLWQMLISVCRQSVCPTLTNWTQDDVSTTWRRRWLVEKKRSPYQSWWQAWQSWSRLLRQKSFDGQGLPWLRKMPSCQSWYYHQQQDYDAFYEFHSNATIDIDRFASAKRNQLSRHSRGDCNAILARHVRHWSDARNLDFLVHDYIHWCLCRFLSHTCRRKRTIWVPC